MAACQGDYEEGDYGGDGEDGDITGDEKGSCGSAVDVIIPA